MAFGVRKELKGRTGKWPIRMVGLFPRSSLESSGLIITHLTHDLKRIKDVMNCPGTASVGGQGIAIVIESMSFK
jgi:hypothetical protein